METKSPFSLTVIEAASAFETNVLTGLTTAEAELRLQKYGPNAIEKEVQEKWWKILFKQFLAPVVYMLIAAAIISFVLKDIAEGIAIPYKTR